MSNSKVQIRAGIVLSYASQVVNALTGLLYTPVMLRLLGKSEYGLYELVNSVVSYLSLIGLGFSSSYQRYYANEKNKKDSDVPRLNGMYLVIFLIMSLICLVCGFIMIQNTELIFKKGLTEAEIEKSKILFVLMIASMAVTFPNSLFTSYITAHEQFIFQKSLIVIQGILNPFICLPLLLKGYGSVSMTIVSTCLTYGVFVSNILFCVIKLKMRIRLGLFDWSIFKDIWGFTFFIFLNEIVNQINWGVDKFLLGREKGTDLVAVYGAGQMIQLMYGQLSKSISNVYIPKINKIVADSNDNTVLTKLFTKVGRLQAMVLIIIVCGFTWFGKAFVNLWVGKGYEDSFIVAEMFLLALFVPYIQNLGIEIQRAKNKHRIRAIVYSLIALGNIGISIMLIPKYGVIGAATGTVIALVLGNIIFMNFYYHYYIGLNLVYFWKEIAKLIPLAVITAALGWGLTQIFDCTSWKKFLIAAFTYLFLYLLLLLIGKLFKRKKKDDH